MHAKNLSCVNGSNLSNISINIEKLVVPIIDFIKKSFPNLYPANIKRGIFNARIVVPIGIFKK